MTPTNQTPCINPGCTAMVDQKPKGRRRLYCCESCGRWYRKYCRPALEGDDNDQYALQIAEEAHRLTRDILALTGAADQPLEAARLVHRASTALAHLRDALVQQAHDRTIKPATIARALNVSTDSVSRWRKDAGDRRQRTLKPPPLDSQTVQTAPRTHPRIPQPRTATVRSPEPGPARGAPVGGAPGQPSAPVPSTTTFASRLAGALSTLQRQNSPSYATLGRAAGVSRSYISRILSGERTPSWDVTLKITLECGGDPDAVRPLWEAARGYHNYHPASLQAMLRGLQLAAGNVPLDELSARAGHSLTGQQIMSLLRGTGTAEWSSVRSLVIALRGEPEAVHPLWQAAQAPLSMTTPDTHGATVTSLCAGSFG
ncbi:helix-turn-helix domain-containing protein [[Kitasatospora] papulosa]|uniref:helix-turn-helix domain-containing protein n=1 Tax=[Kitasatospora] papulosa TaxID=1464011 RepID=UPI0036BD5CF5